MLFCQTSFLTIFFRFIYALTINIKKKCLSLFAKLSVIFLKAVLKSITVLSYPSGENIHPHKPETLRHCLDISNNRTILLIYL